MRVQSSHLALRFYEHDGWTEEILNPCVKYGEIERTGGKGWWYWRLVVHGGFDVDKLMKHVTKVERWYKPEDKGYPQETDREYIKNMNW